MKKIIWALTALILLSTFFGNFQAAPDHQDKLVVTLESKTADATPEDLLRSGEIIASRLETFSISGIQVLPVPGQGQLKVTFTASPKQQEVLRLLTAKGEVRFCAVRSRSEFGTVLNNWEDTQNLKSLLQLDRKELDPSSGAATLGTYTPGQAEAINRQLDGRGQLPANLQLAWGYAPETDDSFELYALQLDDQSQPIVDGRYIEKVQLTKNTQLDNFSILISFDRAGTQRWARGTTSNVDRHIAIAVDQLVYLAPKVVEPIMVGQMQIAGDFSEHETRWLTALIANGELPLELEIVAME